MQINSCGLYWHEIGDNAHAYAGRTPIKEIEALCEPVYIESLAFVLWTTITRPDTRQPLNLCVDAICDQEKIHPFAAINLNAINYLAGDSVLPLSRERFILPRYGRYRFEAAVNHELLCTLQLQVSQFSK